MNETQYYSAKTENWGEVVGFEKDGYFYFLCFCGNNPHESKTFFFTDLKPVKFVPQDAAVIEGVSAEDLQWFFGNIKTDISHRDAQRLVEIHHEIARQLPQLTPPKPRPAEPTEFGAMVEAEFLWDTNDPDSKSNRRKGRFVKVSDQWYLEDSPTRRSMSFGRLIDPVILEGQVK